MEEGTLYSMITRSLRSQAILKERAREFLSSPNVKGKK